MTKLCRERCEPAEGTFHRVGAGNYSPPPPSGPCLRRDIPHIRAWNRPCTVYNTWYAQSIDKQKAETPCRLSELESTRRRADGRPSDVLCVSLSICLSRVRARCQTGACVRREYARHRAGCACALCVMRRTWKSDRGDARTTTRSTRLLDTVVALASVEYIYIYTHEAGV